MKQMKLTNLELTELIKANYNYSDSTDFYNIQDILMMIDKLLKRDDVDRKRLLDLLKTIETNKEL